MSTALRVYRRSQIEDSDCLFRWNEIHNNGVDDSSDYSIRGQAFAHIKHLYILRLVEKQVPTDQEEALAAFVQGVAEHQTPQRLIPELRELFMRHAEVFTLDLERFVASEEPQQGQGAAFTPDLVYANPNELEIVDDKTFWTMLTEAELRQSFQGRYYSRHARHRWPNFQSYRFTMCFVRFNKTVSVVYTQAELDHADLETEAAISRLTHAAETNAWPAVAGPSCRYCELRCPLVQLETRMPIRLEKHQVGQVAALVLTGEKFLRSLKKALKAYCAANGPVPVGDVVFANRPQESRIYPLMAVADWLQKRGQFGAFEDLGVSHSALKKLFTAFPDAERDLAPLVKSKTTFRFSGRRPGDDEGDDE